MSYTAEQTLALVEGALAGFDPDPAPLDDPYPQIVGLASRFREAAEAYEAIQGNVLYVSPRTNDPRISGGGLAEGTFVAPAPYANVVLVDAHFIGDVPQGITIGTHFDRTVKVPLSEADAELLANSADVAFIAEQDAEIIAAETAAQDRITHFAAVEAIKAEQARGRFGEVVVTDELPPGMTQERFDELVEEAEAGYDLTNIRDSGVIPGRWIIPKDER